MQAYLANIHAQPDDLAPKLAYADWWAQSVDPRADLIRARENLRQHPDNPDALTRCLTAAGNVLGSAAERRAVRADLSSLLEVRTQVIHEADCAARVLCVFERGRPGDDRPRRAVEATRAFAAMRIGPGELLASAAAARQATEVTDEPESSAALAAAVAAEFFLPYGCYSAGMLAEMVVEMAAGHERAEGEANWQLGRFIDLWLYGWDYPMPASERDAL
jgi:uncharacterized protein (TIGR02996 family)